MTLTQLRVLIAVAELGGFSRAASALGQTQPYVSRTVRALESAFGGPLFVRGPAGATATALGCEVLERARQTLRAFDALREMATGKAARLKGTLKLAAPQSLADWPARKLLEQMRRRHPELAVRLFEGTPEECAAWLEDGVADLALTTHGAPGWAWSPLTKESFVAVGHWPTDSRNRDAVTMKEIAARPLVLSSCGIESVLKDYFAARGLALKVAYRSRSYSTVFSMVEEGLGVAIVPKSLVPESLSVAAGCACRVRAITEGPARTIGILSRALPGRAAKTFLAEAEALTL